MCQSAKLAYTYNYSCNKLSIEQSVYASLFSIVSQYCLGTFSVIVKTNGLFAALLITYTTQIHGDVDNINDAQQYNYWTPNLHPLAPISQVPGINHKPKLA